jgi:putative transcriptional regulator
MDNELRSKRILRGLTQGELGEAVGVSRQTINAIETGRYLPSLPLAFALAHYFELRVEDLFHPEPGEIG